MKITPARKSAFEILLRIERDAAFSSILLPQYEDILSGADRALCHQIVLGVLRTQIQLDRTIDLLAGQKKLDLEVRIALRMGLYQLIFLDRIPDHSAVSESVELVAFARKGSAKGLVNAVLRRAAKGTPKLEPIDALDALEVETSHPRHLLELWEREFGLGRTAALARANNEIPAVAFRVTLKGIEQGVVGEEFGAISDSVPDTYIALDNMDTLRGMAANGQIYFQDEASQLVASLVDIPKKGKILDVCAAPGSKTTMIAARPDDPGNLMFAGDLHLARVRSLRENCLRQGLANIRFVNYDAESVLPFDTGIFDSVLVDAPCSGTGTIRSNPEIRYRVDVSVLAEMHSKQLAMLRNASHMVNIGGTLTYSTCSLQSIENELVANEFLNSDHRFSVVEADDRHSRFRSGRFLRTFPDRDKMDGFFVAKFRRDN